MKNFLNKQREIIIILLYVAIVASLIYFVILPILSRISGMRDQIQQESMKQESVKLHISELPRIQKQYETLQGSADLVGVLLDKNKAVILIEKLEKLAESTDNKIIIAVQDNIANATVKKAPVKGAASSDGALIAGLPSSDYLQLKITLTGEYNSIVRFVDLLEKFEYYADITAVQINNDKISTSSIQSASNNGMFNNANTIVTKGAAAALRVSGDDVLTASLDSVFYIK